LVLSQEQLSPEQEMVQDLMTIQARRKAMLAQLPQKARGSAEIKGNRLWHRSWQPNPGNDRGPKTTKSNVCPVPCLPSTSFGRTKRMQRRISLQKRRAKKLGQKASRRQHVCQLRLSRLHARIANIRKDAAHKVTTDSSRRFETVILEDVNVSGMAKNHSLAGAVLDCGFGEIRRQFEYQQAMRGGRVVIANRFFPSTQICSCCSALTGPKGERKCTLSDGSAANAAPSTIVMQTPQSTSGSWA
jgi:hypothetical protein